MKQGHYIPSAWSASAVVVFAAMMGMADAALIAWWVGSALGVALVIGVAVGIVLSIAWALQRYLPEISIGLVVAAVGLASVVPRSAATALSSLLLALGVWSIWFLVYDVWFTGRANKEVISPITTLGGDGRAGRALSVYHQGRGATHFQARMQRAFAEALQARGWQVDITTASRQTPTDLSRYDLVVLGAQAYNWRPARPVIDYVDRVATLRNKPVVAIVSGGGMTERAMQVLQAHIVKSGGLMMDAIEIWTSRDNEARHGLRDPVEIMRRAAARVPLLPHVKTA